MTEPRPVVAFYGDDFTGSTDVLAQFHRFGLRGLLLIDQPDAATLTRLAADYDVLGVAGVARSLPPELMDAEIRPTLAAFRAVGPRVVQYKMCSTADSSPRLGSLGRAVEIGREVFGERPAPVLAAQPEFGRYTVFGHHFAAEAGQVFRLDRQPTMANHPATPMTESDLRRHLAAQTELPIAGLDITAYEPGYAEALRRYRTVLDDKPGAIVFDALHAAHLRTAAALMLAEAEDGPLFALGSGGLSYGLASQFSGADPAAVTGHASTLRPTGKLLAVSGSCSAKTADQISHALAHGWLALPVNPRTELDELTGLAERVLDLLDRAEHGVVVYTALGAPDADGPVGLVDRIGSALGHVVGAVLRQTAVRRVIVAGGDTSGRVIRAIGARAVTVDHIVGVGAVVCRVVSGDPAVHDAQIMLKGGQVGEAELFEAVRLGSGFGGLR